MTFRRAQFWVWWLLPLLVARSLMPVGFMAQAHDGQLHIVFCTSGYSQTQDHHDLQPKASHDQTQNDFSCPFGHTAAAPLLDIDRSEAIEFLPVAEILPPAEAPYYAVGPPRFIATRGPPVHS